MPPFVLEMSTDRDVVNTPVSAKWGSVAGRFHWSAVKAMNLSLINGSTIIVVAHGNNSEIGNDKPGTIDIDAETFLAIVAGNMANGGSPASVYISACADKIAEFAARVCIAAGNNYVWQKTRIFGHADPVIGEVPGPKSLAWFEIF